MARRSRPRFVFPIVVLACLLAALPAPVFAAPRSAESATTGRWLIDFQRDGSVQVTLKRRSEDGNNSWNSSDDYRLGDFQGLQRPAGETEAPAHFQMVRDAGTLTFEGQLGASGGAGHYTFAPNPEYLAALATMGYRTPDADEVFSLAVQDVSRTFIRDLDALGYKHLPIDEMIAMRIHGASPAFIREMKALGYDHLSSDDLVAMRIHGATPAFIGEMKAAGYDHLSAEDLVSMRIHGATPDFVRELRALGYQDLSSDDLVSLRIHGVTPNFIRDLQRIGYKDVPADDLVSMRIHGVSVEYARKMKARYANISVEKLVDAKIHARG